MTTQKCPKCGQEYDPLYSLGHTCKGRLGFGWGNLWIAMHIILFFITIFSLIRSASNGELKSLINEKGLLTISKYIIFLIFYSIVSFGSAYGLALRKKSGLYFTYTFLGIFVGWRVVRFIISSISFLIKHDFSSGIATILLAISIVVFELFFDILIAYLWFRYFERRKAEFT